MSEPLATIPNPAGTGRPLFTDEQYQKFLDEMREYLRRGCSLYYAMDKAGLLNHQTAIYEKYRLNDWFSQKINALRSTIGEMVNEVAFRVVERVKNRLVETDGMSSGMTTEEVKIIALVAEKHRAAQPFFVSRTENADVSDKPVGKVLDVLETNYDELADQASQASNGAGPEAKGQVVASNAPVQNSGQEGQSPDVQAESGAAPAPGGTT